MSIMLPEKNIALYEDSYFSVLREVFLFTSRMKGVEISSAADL